MITAESDAVPVYRSLAGIVFCFRIITSRADTPRRFVLGKSSSHMTIPLRQGSSRRVFVSGVFVSLCAEPRRGQLVLVIRRVRELPISPHATAVRLSAFLALYVTPACGRDSERSKGRCATKLPRIADGATNPRGKPFKGWPWSCGVACF